MQIVYFKGESVTPGGEKINEQPMPAMQQAMGVTTGMMEGSVTQRCFNALNNITDIL